jgi:predicted phage terminase large subunit-like protein
MMLTPDQIRNVGPEALEKVRAELARRSFAEYVKQAWPVIEPGTPLVWGWVIDAICEHLEACNDGQIKRLVINVPPGSMKSKLTSVLWPTWCWTNRGHLKFLSSSYALNLAERNNVEARRILQSEWYTNTFGVGISTEEGGKVNFSNDKYGVMRAISVDGATTGYRGDMFVIDDPHDVSKAESDARRTDAVKWFMESAQNRLNSLVDSVIVVVMQRVHEEDVSSIALEMGYDHLCIPMRWEEELRKYTTIGWTDPRSNDGELMWPERFPKTELDQLESNMGAYATAAQNQQRPAPRKGGMFAVDNIQQIDELPDEPFIEVRAWDFAGSGGTGAYSAGVKMLYGLKSKEFIIADVRRGQWSGGKVREKVSQAAEDDGVACGIMIPQDPGSAGKVQAEDYVAMLTGYNARIEVQSGSKETRAEPFSAQVEVNRVKILKRLWTKPFLDELRFFPKAKLKDQVDAAASAFNRLAFLSRKDRAKPRLVAVGEKQENTARSI